MRAPWKRAVVAAMSVALSGWSATLAEERVKRTHVDPLHTDDVAPERAPLDGRAFPEGVLSLTWDDGPDVHTLELARWLAEQKVSATFFVVGEWDRELSSDPGFGAATYRTGYRHIAILGDLVRLGHRIGNHTLDHTLLADTSIEGATEQLVRAQVEIDPFIENELRLFRAPGGQWSRDAASALDDPRLAGLVGPVRWDIDGKDWEASLRRTRPEAVAERYVAQIDRARRGIVLLHDRVGDVGSTYALDVAKRLVPQLKARGFVFAAPVLSFSALRPRDVRPPVRRSLAGDLNGDGHVDECAISNAGVTCALSNGRMFMKKTLWLDAPVESAWLSDVNGDGRADLCTEQQQGGVACGLAP
jgi:peptidoglycan/xylan/chitin deacetylase (PgdA/CDA1 family)